MSKYSKSRNASVEIVGKDGKKLKVSQYAFDTVYSKKGFKISSEVGGEQTPPSDEGGQGAGAVDFATLSEGELKKVKNDDLKAYLDEKGIEYKADAVKDDYVNAILGK